MKANCNCFCAFCLRIFEGFLFFIRVRCDTVCGAYKKYPPLQKNVQNKKFTYFFAIYIDFFAVLSYNNMVNKIKTLLTIDRSKTMALVNTKEMFKKAYEGGYAIGAFNINNMEIVQAITEAAGELKSPVILQVSAGARKYAKQEYLLALAQAAIKDAGVDLALHLDHGADFEICKACIDGGFTSVMIDGSHHSFEDNIAVTKKVVDYAHERGVTVEGELGVLAGVEDDVVAEHSSYTKPSEVEEFVARTGVDSLAISIGTSHGAYKFTPAQCTRNEKGILVPPPLRFDILEEIMEKIPGFPIVLLGASSVPQDYVQEINSIGGRLPDAVGIPEEQLRKAATLAVCKINIDSDIRLAMTAGIRRVLTAQPDVFDPRTYLTVARAEVKKMVAHKIQNVLGSANTL